MPSSAKVGDLSIALQQRLFPSVTVWNRLEARPRAQDFTRALQAEVRDALWMLTKQWQMGEFRGSDTGSPVFSKLLLETTRLTKYRPGTSPTEAFEMDLPLEAKVERRPIPLQRDGRPMSVDLRLSMGRYWLRLVADLPDHRSAYVQTYAFSAPDPTKASDADLCPQPESWQLLSAIAGRAMDGGALYLHLVESPANHAYDAVTGVSSAEFAAIDDRAGRFLAWFNRSLLQPTLLTGDAWEPAQLEYRFAASAPIGASGDEDVFTADEFYGDRLDWYSLDRDAGQTALDPVAGSDVTGLPADAPRTMIPIPATFSGMPNTRWWSFEDRKTNFGDINASTTDLPKLLFLEFALVFANDWFVIPYTLPAGALASVRGLSVTNVFGDRTWIEAAGRGADADWQRWSMFTINIENSVGTTADNTLLLLPTVGKVQQSPPTEDVLLVRDEVANMVWGIERMVPLPTGESRAGKEVAAQTTAYLQGLLAAAPAPVLAPNTANIRYEVMSSVPENWIPFLPVHVPGSNREIQLQRSALPRILAGDPNPPAKVKPRSVLLRQGLDQTPALPYFVHEEEVPRAGVRIQQCFARTRWTDGQVYTWLRALKQTGRGEASSGLAFDEIISQAPKTS